MLLKLSASAPRSMFPSKLPVILRKRSQANRSANSSVIDIWSLQPQPHLQPRATLSTLSRGSDNETDVPVTVTTAPPSEHGQQAAADKRGGTVPKHWGEVVINPRKERRSRTGLNDEEGKAGNVFGVLNVA